VWVLKVLGNNSVKKEETKKLFFFVLEAGPFYQIHLSKETKDGHHHHQGESDIKFRFVFHPIFAVRLRAENDIIFARL
jgi:hypothetical protein